MNLEVLAWDFAPWICSLDMIRFFLWIMGELTETKMKAGDAFQIDTTGNSSLKSYSPIKAQLWTLQVS